MKKTKFVLAVLLVVLICALTVTCMAHSGRTDAKGGHYDRSTGNYHYHHGRSAHDHYDIDGDGVKDCPYDFKTPTKLSFRDQILCFLFVGSLICVFIYEWKK